VLNTCLGENEGGLNGLSAEVTISGGMTYGSVWDPGGLPDGQYRMTFSLQEGSKVDITEDSVLYASAEEGEESVTELAAAEESEEGGAPQGNEAKLVPELNLTYIDVGLGTRTDEVPTCPAPPAPPSGGTSTSTPAAPAAAPVSTEQTPADQGGQPEATTPQLPPQAATGLFVQKAKIKALKSGKYEVGTKIVLAKKRVKTSAGVTVRWRATVRSLDNCKVKVRKGDGKATVKLIKPGRCRIIAWAPPASPDWTGFRETRTYRVRNVR
jgi:hypothetical protein